MGGKNQFSCVSRDFLSSLVQIIASVESMDPRNWYIRRTHNVEFGHGGVGVEFF